jgi:hypothetical protein
MGDLASQESTANWRVNIEVRPKDSSRQWTTVLRVGWSEYLQNDYDHLRSGLFRFCRSVKRRGAGEERVRFGQQGESVEDDLYQGPIGAYKRALCETGRKEAASAIDADSKCDGPFRPRVAPGTVVPGRGQVVLSQSRIGREGINLDLADVATIRDLTDNHARDWHSHETRKDDEWSAPCDSTLESSIILSLVMEAAAACKRAVPKREHQRALGLLARWQGHGSCSVTRKDLQGWWDCWSQAQASSAQARLALLARMFDSLRSYPSLIQKIDEFAGEPVVAEVRVSICDDMGLAGKCRRFMRDDLRTLDSWTTAVDYKIEAEARLRCDEALIKDRSSDLQWWRCELWRNQEICDGLLRLWVDDLKHQWKVYIYVYREEENLNKLMTLETWLTSRVVNLSSARRYSCMIEQLRYIKSDSDSPPKLLELVQDIQSSRQALIHTVSAQNEKIASWLEEKGVPLTVDLPTE